MYELKKNGRVFTSKFFGTGLSTYEKNNLPGRGLTRVEKHRYTTVWKADTVAGGKLQLVSLIPQTLKNHWASSVYVRDGRIFIPYFLRSYDSDFVSTPTDIFCTSINTVGITVPLWKLYTSNPTEHVTGTPTVQRIFQWLALQFRVPINTFPPHRSQLQVTRIASIKIKNILSLFYLWNSLSTEVT